MQDIEIKRRPRGQMTVRVLFDNGSEVTLVRNAFAMKARFKWQPATYTLAGVGRQAQSYSATNGGRLWSVVLQDNESKTEGIEALGVPKILGDTVGQGSYRELAKRFPDVSLWVFKELPEH